MESDFDKFNRLSYAIADGLNGEEANLFAQANSDVMTYYTGLTIWLKGDVVALDDSLAFACIKKAMGLTINRMLGGDGDPVIGVA